MQTLVKNWTLQRFARVAEKKERNGTNEKSDTRKDLNPGTRLVAPMPYPLSYSTSVPVGSTSGQYLNFNPNKLSNLKFILSLSFRHVDFDRHAVLLIVFLFS